MSTIKYKLANAPIGLVAMEAITEIEQLEQELQKTREILEELVKSIYVPYRMGIAVKPNENWKALNDANELIGFFKDKQGEVEMSMTKKTMTVEEMVARWPECPPFKVATVDFGFIETTESGKVKGEIGFVINQDTIQEIREYLDAVEETMNG